MTSTQPPGWYPDATLPGHERWWDGTAWSPVTRLAPDLAASGYGVTDGAPSGQDSAWGAQAPSEAFEQPQPSQAAADPWGAPAQSASWDAPSAPSAPSAPDYGSPPYASPHQAPGDYGGSPYATPSSGGQPAAPEYSSQPGGSSYPPPPAGSAPYPGYGQPPPPGRYQQYPSYPSGPYSANPYGEYAATHNLAGQGTRLLARLIDGVLLGVVITIVGLPFLRPFLDEIQKASDAGAAAPSTSELYGTLIPFIAVAAVIGLAYEVILIGLRGATLGKMALGIKVQRADGTAGAPGLGVALIRWATMQLPSLIPFLGNIWSLIDPLWCLWDSRRQCLHDKAASTIVVRSR